MAGSAVWSIIDAHRAAERTNLAARRAITFAPTPMAGPDRSTGFGLSAVGTF